MYLQRLVPATIVVACGAVFVACGGGGGDGGGGGGPTPTPVPVAAVEVAPGDTAIVMENSAPLRVALRDSTGALLTGRAVTWSSSAPATASVTASGMVHGLLLGTVTVTATSEGKSGQATLRVVPRVVVAPEFPSLFSGDTLQLTAQLLTASGLPAGSAAVSWSTAAAGTAAVAGNGVVSGVATGTAHLTATAAGGWGGVDVMVVRRPGVVTRKVAWVYSDAIHPTAGYEINELWTGNPDGSGATRVSALGDYVSEYAWSPDGSRLVVQYLSYAYGAGPTVSRTALVAINADGSGEVALGTGGSHPRWSPDGERIAFRDYSGDLNVVSRDGTHHSNLTPGEAVDNLDPEWSPDGRLLVYKRQPTWCDEMWVIRPDGMGRRRLTIPTGMCEARFSPDGKYIAYMSYGPGTPSETGAWLASPWGGAATPISPNCTAMGSCSAPSYAPGNWLTDGYRVLVRGGTLSIYDVRTRASTPLTLPASPNLVVGLSPDESSVLYAYLETDGRPRIGTMTTAGGGAMPTTALGRSAANASWQPAP